ncbi:hypothetical protein [Sphingomonas nostoxanthinifaciens]|uniref:hypothetical protein n=1 Tax=Sphingomonas nostoxanthinifaciens TaxID=2872652 RepID=UPI001CC20A72|nr:hypothetical protein [Sphingomonas nostoxanthinifaciens]UAK24970.1 hypothetical protein K8P63_01785 [Sphingomonas nostoxanthinifaciens]
MLALTLLVAGPALAESAPPTAQLQAEDKAIVTRLNRAAANRAGASTTSSQSQDQYARALADYQAALSRNDRERKAAADANDDYARAQAAYRAEMARWRASVATNAYPR